MKNPELRQVLTPLEYQKILKGTEIRNVRILDLTIGELCEMHGFLFAPDRNDAKESLELLFERAKNVPEYDLFTSENQRETANKTSSGIALE